MIFAALLLAGYNLFDERRAGTEANRVLSALQNRMPDEENEISVGAPEEAELPDYLLNPNVKMPVEEVEGNGYIGVLEIPVLEMTLPVMSDWSYSGLRIAPCRYSGSVYTEDMVVAGHNYSTHFGGLGGLSPGAQVIFTDIEGNRFVYEVTEMEVLEPSEGEKLLSGEWNLTLFTCTPGTQGRVTVRCRAV